MHKNIVFAVFGYLLSWSVFSQTTIEGILQQIERNNQELKAMSAYRDSRQLELKSGNNLPDPQFGMYYLPFGEHTTGNYSEFQISQAFDFPTVYGARSKLIAQQSGQLELEYLSMRQQILSLAKSYCLEIIYLNKRLVAENQRVAQAKKVFEQVQELYDKEQVGILELNKAKVVWMQDQFRVQQIENDRRNVLISLQNLNGGTAIPLESNEYFAPLEIDEKDRLWQIKLSKDPALIQWKQQETIAAQQVNLAKNKTLPNLTAGYNSQGVAGERFSGLYGGISIPLWSNRNKVRSARFHLTFREALADSKTMEEYAFFENQYNDYQLMLSKFGAYESTLSDLASDLLLLQAYELGEISYLEYYMELQFYRQAYDTMLEVEYQLYRLRNELLKHEL